MGCTGPFSGAADVPIPDPDRGAGCLHEYAPSAYARQSNRSPCSAHRDPDPCPRYRDRYPLPDSRFTYYRRHRYLRDPPWDSIPGAHHRFSTADRTDRHRHR